MTLPENGIKNKISAAILFFVLVAIPFQGSGQDEPDKHAHQVSINASKFIKGIFPGQEHEYEIGYRYALTEKLSLRSAINFYNQTTDDGYLEGGLKLGADYTFKESGNWSFYYGADLMGQYIGYRSSERENYQLGIMCFLGVIYYIGDHFSLSTEPGVFGLYNHYFDRDSFSDHKVEEYFTFGLGNIGQLTIGFHF